ncbi:MAG: hypothetical protein M1820_010749, partial [Bogoriella megaspora]
MLPPPSHRRWSTGGPLAEWKDGDDIHRPDHHIGHTEDIRIRDLVVPGKTKKEMMIRLEAGLVGQAP